MDLPNIPEHLDLNDLAERLTTVDGMVAVLLGGSRARGEHSPESDVDLGLYYRDDLDIAALGALARDVAGPDAQVTQRGEWGPWVDGGAWLDIDGIRVDWIYRDLDRVHDAWARAHRGTFDWNTQTGHPLGVPDFAYVGEVALGVIITDPTRELTELQQAITYPDALATALLQNLWEASFLVTNAGKAARRGDAAYLSLGLSRALLLCAHALHGHDHQWVVNEKGAVASASRLPSAPQNFAERVTQILGHLGTTPRELAESVDAARQLVDEVEQACQRP